MKDMGLSRYICRNCNIVFEYEKIDASLTCPKCKHRAWKAYNEGEMKLSVVYSYVICLWFIFCLIFLILFSFFAISLSNGIGNFILYLVIIVFIIAITGSTYGNYTAKKDYRLAWGKNWNDNMKRPQKIINYHFKKKEKAASRPAALNGTASIRADQGCFGRETDLAK